MWRNRLIFSAIFSLFPAFLVDLFFNKSNREFGPFFGFISFFIIYFVSFPVFIIIYDLTQKIKKLKKRKMIQWLIIFIMAGIIYGWVIKPLLLISKYQYNDFLNVKGGNNPFVNLYLWNYYCQIALLKVSFILTSGLYLLLQIKRQGKTINEKQRELHSNSKT